MRLDLEDQLRQFGEWHDEVQNHVEPTGVVDRVRPLGPRSAPMPSFAGRRAAASVGLAAVLVVVVIGVPLLLSLGDRSPSVPSGDPTSTTPPPVEETSPERLPEGNPLQVASWYRVVDVAGYRHLALRDVIDFDGRLIAVGNTGVTVVSGDGIDWDVASTDVRATVVVAGGPGLIALGPGSAGVPSVWSSTDGISWTIETQPNATSGHVEVNDVVVGGPGYVAVGWAFASNRLVSAVWTSTNGLQWTRVPHDPGVFGPEAFGSRDDTLMLSVAAGNGVLVAVGQGGVWRSTGGTDWSRAQVVLTGDWPAEEEFYTAGRATIAFFEGAFITAQGWSVDGVTWNRFDPLLLPNRSGFTGSTLFEVVGDRLVALQRPGMGFPWTMHASTDGRTWSDLVGLAEPGYNAHIKGGPGMVGVGEDGVAIWFDDPSDAAAYGDRLVEILPPEDDELARSLLEPRAQAIESMLAAYNQARSDDWRASFLGPPELGNGLGPNAEASFMAAAGRWELIGPCVTEPEVVICPTHRSDAFYGVGGFDHDARFVFFFAPHTDDLIGYEVAEDAGPSDWFDGHGAFELAFIEWLERAHPDVSVSRGPDWIGIATADMPTALQYVAEFVAQSDVYPIEPAG